MAAGLRLLVLAFVLSAAFVLPAAGGNVIEDACKQTTVNYDYCVKALSSVPKARKAADATGIAAVALKMASKNTTASGNYVAKLHEDNDDPQLEECLAVCKEDYMDAAEHLTDAEVAFDDKKYDEVLQYVDAALEFIKYCQESCHAVPKNKNVLTKRNKDVKVQCSIATSLVKLVH